MSVLAIKDQTFWSNRHNMILIIRCLDPALQHYTQVNFVTVSRDFVVYLCRARSFAIFVLPISVQCSLFTVFYILAFIMNVENSFHLLLGFTEVSVKWSNGVQHCACHTYGRRFEPWTSTNVCGQSHVCKYMDQKGIVAMLTPIQSAACKGIHPGFESQGRCHQKSITGVSVSGRTRISQRRGHQP